MPFYHADRVRPHHLEKVKARNSGMKKAGRKCPLSEIAMARLRFVEHRTVVSPRVVSRERFRNYIKNP